MALIVVGGHSRNVGKTSVVAGLIAALRGHEWNCSEDHAARPRDLLCQRRSL